MANETIGMVECPLSGELAAVRKDKRGAFYYISIAGRIAPSADFGQEWFLEHATIWGDGPPPDDCPDWIAQGKSYPPATRSKIRKPAKHHPPAEKPAAPEPHPSPARKDDTPPAAAQERPAGGSNPFSILDW